MKTNLKRTINTVQEARSFLEELHSNGELDVITPGTNLTPDDICTVPEFHKLMAILEEIKSLEERGKFTLADTILDLIEPPIEAPEVDYHDVKCCKCPGEATQEGAFIICLDCGHVEEEGEDPDIIADILHDFCSEDPEQAHEVDIWSQEEILEEWQQEKLREILKDIEEEDEIFYLDGESYSGNGSALARMYVIENPSKGFRTWLIDKGLRHSDGILEAQHTKRVYFKVKTPGFFADLTHKEKGGHLASLGDAQEALRAWSETDPSSEYYEYWRERGRRCVIVRVTEIEEVIQEAQHQEA